jgi:hypothetical protein
MESSLGNSEDNSIKDVESNISLGAMDASGTKKRKKYLKVEKLGESAEYDDSLLKRRK